MKVKACIFDLDGTLLDTSAGIYESIKYSVKKNNYPELSQEQLRPFIGPPLRESFMKVYGCSEEEADMLTNGYREHYREGALLLASPYEGIYEMLDQLQSRGIILSVATSKPQLFAQQVLTHHGFDPYLSAIHGVDMNDKFSKADMIRMCVEDAQARPEECVMIGDTQYDARGAQEAEVPFLAAAYGFGSLEKMREYPCVGVAERPLDIAEMVCEEDDSSDTPS